MEIAPSARDMQTTSRQFYSTSEIYLAMLGARQESEYDFILGAIRSYSAGGAVLDYGCGIGLMSMLLAKNGFTVTGVDISEQFIESAKSRFGKHPSMTFEVIDGLPLRFPEGAFDVVASSDVLEHCTGIDDILREFKRLLRPGGLLVIETPNMLSPLARLKLIGEKLAGRRKTFHRYGTPGFLFQSLLYLTRKLILRRQEFIYTNPKYVDFSEADEDVSYLSNPLDYLFFLRDEGFEVLELSRNKGFVRELVSKYAPSIAGGVMIVARKK